MFKKVLPRICLLLSLFVIQNCGENPVSDDQNPEPKAVCIPSTDIFYGSASQQSWISTKNVQAPQNQLPNEFEAPQIQKLANQSWEDGLYITRDGLTLYSFFSPMDFLKAFFDNASPENFWKYQRGTLIGQDFKNPLDQPKPWLHADVAVSRRSSLSDVFCNWSLSNLKGQYYNLGAPQGILNSSNSSVFDIFVYTDDSGTAGTKIKMMKNVGLNLTPSASGTLLPANVNEPSYRQDNPHIERFDKSDSNKLVLFFESSNKPGVGNEDIWYSTSADGGTTWTNPTNVSTINTAQMDIQPHLFFDGNIWWLYYATMDTTTNKLSIFRARQGTPNDWNSWQNKELVISPGTALAVGEPTLTAKGDISFVVVTQNNSGGTATDTYDADPWFMRRK